MGAIGGPAIAITIDGKTYETTGDSWKVNTGGVKREEKMAGSGDIEFTETPIPGVIEGKIYVRSLETADEIKAKTKASVLLELRNKKCISGVNMVFMGEGDYDGNEGTLPILFKNKKLMEI